MWPRVGAPDRQREFGGENQLKDVGWIREG